MKSKICIFLSILLLVTAISLPRKTGGTDSAAEKVERIAARRIAMLEKYADKMLAASPYEWPDIGNLPGDMVIYRYVGDSLQCWVNQFSVVSDNIAGRSVFKRLTNPRVSPGSPLSEVGDSLGFFNFGPKWYLARSRSEGDVRLIYGLAVRNSLDNRTYNGVNPVFRLSDNYSIQTLSSGEGSVVSLEGRPLMRVRYESLSGEVAADGLFIWLAFTFYVLGFIFLLNGRRTLRQLLLVSSGMLLAVTAMYFWGRNAQDQYVLFSPTLYADGQLFYSLGAIVFINLAILLLSVCLFLARKAVFDRMNKRRRSVFGSISAVIWIAAILLYTHFSLKSIILNSDVSLELYKYETLSRFTFIVYLSYLTMLLSIPLLLSLVKPSFRLLVGVKFDPLSVKSRVFFSVVFAVYMVLISSVLGFRKERERIDVWAGRLAFDRDASLEMILLRTERQIEDDPILASLTLLENGESSILHRLTDVHFARLTQKYEVSILSADDYIRLFGRGNIVSPDSNYLFAGSDNGHPRYACVFHYAIPGYGITHLAICIEPRSDRYTGDIPSIYSYARYRNGRVIFFDGGYAYPLRMEVHPGHYSFGGSMHFVNRISDGDYVVMSRAVISPINYLISAVFLSLVAFLAFSFLCIGRPVRRAFGRNYFRTRINTIVMAALTLTLLTMMTVSVIFVYRRNESNLRNMMSDKINGIQSLLAARVRALDTAGDLVNPEVFSLLETVGLANDTEISLFSIDGKILMSGGMSRDEKAFEGIRMNGEAFKRIIFNGDRYCIIKERVARRNFYGLYAPLMNADGNMLAIVNIPYTDENYDFKRDAVSHLVMILTVFLLLLILARFASSTIVDRMFKPLSEMGRKMSRAAHAGMEKIEYHNDDEISSVVQSYNRMVDELEASARVLAQAERDKAWSGMARQVAHEIKNPLTPMKLQLQRIIRLKEKGEPVWQDKFDEMASVLLDHIDILTDTANEFSTFAKLYTEEPTGIDFDVILKEEISMFDSREDITFEYFGLEGSTARGPKPQLTRVFVNLINNAVQAVSDVEGGRVRIALRNSGEAGFYDIVFEDNGPGVSPDNEGKLFTPNFTTKNGGSGLGLAISRSILERCGATITYSRSFSLGGACFTIRYPK